MSALVLLHEMIFDITYGRKLKKWDLRMGTTNTKHVLESDTDPTMTPKSIRPRGITSIVRGSGRTDGLLFGMAFNSQLHIYDEATLGVVERDYAVNSKTKDMLCMSYLVKLSIVGNGERILSGGKEGSACLWDIGCLGTRRNAGEKVDRGPTIERLTGHAGVIGPVDNNRSGFVTCGDDGFVKYWDCTGN